MNYNKHTTAAGLTTAIFSGKYFQAATRFVRLTPDQRAEVLPLIEHASGKTDFDSFMRHVNIEASK